MLYYSLLHTQGAGGPHSEKTADAYPPPEPVQPAVDVPVGVNFRTNEVSLGKNLDRTRILVFIGFAFGISWLAAAAIWLRGGLVESPVVVPVIGFTEALLLIAFLYMPAPALAHVLTRWVTREGWQDLQIRPRFISGWKYWLLAWFGIPALLLLGMLVYFLLFPGYFDSGLTVLGAMLAEAEALSGEAIPLPTAALLPLMFIQGVLLSPILNAPFIFGEEFGWRAYLQQKLMPIGPKKAMVVMGVIWGAWHWPILAMGHNYGLDYPGAPWTGMLAFTWFTFAIGTILSWMTIRAGSVWPAVIGHGVLNGVASIAALLAVGDFNPLLGPSAAGLFAGIPFSILALWLIFTDKLANLQGKSNDKSP